MPAAPTRRGEVTRQRLLEAAAAEFAERGIAGARVDRIVAAAQSNKAQLYQYFGNKERLFDEVFSIHIEWLIAEVPLAGHDLPGYAVAIYNTCLHRPELIRLAAWMRLERNPFGDLLPRNPDAAKVSAIAAAQAAGDVDPAFDPTDILSMVTAMAMSWSPASLQIAASTDDADDVHDRRRAALATAVRQAFTRPRNPK
jgi:AcrR family transcriptional regulator